MNDPCSKVERKNKNKNKRRSINRIYHKTHVVLLDIRKERAKRLAEIRSEGTGERTNDVAGSRDKDRVELGLVFHYFLVVFVLVRILLAE